MALTKVSRNLLNTSIDDNGTGTVITIGSDGAVTFSGTISASGYNDSNWNTAYGWGNHALQSYATESYVNTQVSNIVDSAPATLDTLNELAAALGDDANFSTTVTNQIGTKWTQDNTKISNWDTAYGWGNHASAGYLDTSSTSQTKSGDLTVDQLVTTNNANGTNIRIGDDAWIGDCNSANQIRIQGTNDATKGYISFGSTSNTALGRSGNGDLTWGGGKIWHEGNDGNGSGLDADKLQGNAPSYFTNYTDTQVATRLSTTAWLASAAFGIESSDITNWDTAYGWGDHSVEGYLTSHQDITGKLDKSGGTMTGNITFASAQTFDGRDVSVDGAKLDNIEAGADVTDTANVVAALTAGTNVSIGSDGTISSTDTNTTYSVGDGGLTQKNFTTALKTKLDGIASGAEVNVNADWNASSGDAQILNKPTIPSLSGYATESYVGTQISNLVDSSPSTLNTLNELAAALGDDANFSTTVSNQIGTKWTQDNTKISNWDTAYGWGNHASAGYLTSFDITTQTDSKYVRSDTSDTMSGNLTVTGTITSGSKSVGTQSVVTTAPTSASGFPNGHVWYVVS